MRSISAWLTVGVLMTVSILLTENGSRPALAQTVDARKAKADQLVQQGVQQYRISQFQ